MWAWVLWGRHSESQKVNDFSLFRPLKKASPKQKVSTLNDSSTIFISLFIKSANMQVLSQHASHEGLVLECGSDPLQAG